MLSACVAVLTTLGAGSAIADNIADIELGPREIEEIIVTATRRTTSLQDVPFNVSTIPGDTLERLRLMQLSDLARQVPGLIVIDQGNRAASRMTVRGLNVASLTEESVLFNSSGDTVATYIGDIPVYVDLRMRDMDRVEVLLGPQGTLYGAGTLGGAIRYIPNAPHTTDWEAIVSVSAFGMDESDSTGSDIWAVLNVPLVTGRLGLRVAASRYVDPGYIDYPFLVREAGVSNPQPDFTDPDDVRANLFRVNDADSGEILGAKIALLWNVTETTSATLSYYYQETDYGGRSINHDQSFDSGRYASAHRFLEFNRRENQLLSLEVNANLTFAEFVSATGVSAYDEVGQRDQTDLVLNFGGIEVDFPNFVDFTRDDTEEDRLNQEFRLVSSGEGPWNWIAGAFFNRFNFRHDFNDVNPGLPDFLGISRPDNLGFAIILEEEVEETALFGELGYRINDSWQITLGARQFWSSRTSGNATDIPILFTFLGFSEPDELNLTVQTFDIEDDGTLFKFNTSYRLSDSVTSYFTLSDGFRLGGINAFPACPPNIEPTFEFPCLKPNEISYTPDTTTNYEIGIRSSWKDGSLVLNTAIYHIDWEDIQLEAVTEAGFFITNNGGDAESRGLELDLHTEFGDRWQMALNYSYNTAELTSLAPLVVDSVVDGLPGDRLAGVPEHQAGLQLTYARPFGDSWEFALDYGLTYTSEIYTKVGLRNNGEILSGYSFHNIAATFAYRSNWSVRLFVDNVFDEFAETNVRTDPSFIRSVGVHQLRAYYRNVARPRRYGFEVRYDFSL